MFKVGERVINPDGISVTISHVIEIVDVDGIRSQALAFNPSALGGPKEYFSANRYRRPAPTKYRVVLETENPDQFKMLNGSTFVSSEVIL